MQKVVILSDLHIPFHDETLLVRIIRLICEIKPVLVVFAGDVYDFFGASKYCNSPSRADDLQYELAIGYRFFTYFRKHYKGDVVFIQGNHEERIIKYLNAHARALRSLPCLDLRELLKLNELNIRYITDTLTLNNRFAITHGDHAGVNAARPHLLNRFIGWSGLSGHSHKDDTSTTVDFMRRVNTWTVIGHLGLQDSMEHAIKHKWNQSFAVVTCLPHTEIVEVIKCYNGGFFYNGKVYK